ncbi:nuclear fusion protein kar5 [Moniliophthora roreri MCA 2997]|uniref:Nuclear fusion protein kar5 n=1 Tax=Moniliophthora roreri (strain MCA 2997) TaxID=1381753 RepID=V2WMK3_MONRO|nr:nuclear fusion protein kar5 [Moniliophthora roreri MCA 2997]
MPFSFASLVLLFFFKCCTAIHNSLGDPSSHENEISFLLLKRDALVEYTRRSDCFRSVADMIRLRCEHLDMDEQERVKAAISMTLCELATAKHHSIPLECSSFSINQHSLLEAINPDLQGECVSALSRSAQFWSSYSGYLREIPQLCFTFQRWNDIGMYDPYRLDVD